MSQAVHAAEAAVWTNTAPLQREWSPSQAADNGVVGVPSPESRQSAHAFVSFDHLPGWKFSDLCIAKYKWNLNSYFRALLCRSGVSKN